MFYWKALCVHILYLDESGSAEVLREEHPESPPVFVLGGICVNVDKQRSLNWGFLKLKEKFNPNLHDKKLSEALAFEMKGSSLRSDIRADSRNRNRRAKAFLRELITLLGDHEAKIVAKVNIKRVNEEHRDVQQYPAANRWIMNAFNEYLKRVDSKGIAILDSRTKIKNSPLVSNIVTGMYKTGGGDFGQLIDAPAFGHSDVHIGIQIADHVVSALIFPMACYTYCSEHEWNTHVNPRYKVLIEDFGAPLQALQMSYYESATLRRLGGVYCTKSKERINSSELFKLREEVNPPLFNYAL